MSAEGTTMKSDQFLGGYEIGTTIPFTPSQSPPKPLNLQEKAVVDFFGDDFGFIIDCLEVIQDEAQQALLDEGPSEYILSDLALSYYWKRKLGDAYEKVNGSELS